VNILLTNFMETLSAGGINTTITELATRYSEAGHKVTVVQGNSLKLKNEELYQGFRVIRVNSLLSGPMHELNHRMYSQLKKCVASSNPDVVNIHGYGTLLSLEIAIILKKIIDVQAPVVLTPHYDPLNHNTFTGKHFSKPYDALVGTRFFKMVDYVISISSFEAKNIQNVFHFPPEKMTLIPHGVDRIVVNRRLQKKDTNTIDILYAGYLLQYKGVQDIIKALHELIHNRSVTAVKLTIIGDGDYKQDLVALSKKLNVFNFIVWKPFMPHDKLLVELEHTDMLLLLSKTEGYGIIVAEALSRGVPAIVTKGTALEEFTNEPGCLGVDCLPNPAEVADLILRLHESNIQVGPFSNKIRTWDEVAEDYLRVYEKVLLR
jgi:glycosyltransferase involved in cell wall biosynthesis